MLCAKLPRAVARCRGLQGDLAGERIGLGTFSRVLMGAR